MRLSIKAFAVLLQYSFYQAASGLSCTNLLQSIDCLPAFTHRPTNLTKCYCSSQCPDLDQLRDTCQSGQLQTDPCGVCLQCAPGYGETCGGFANEAGTCAGGLGCLVKYDPRVEAEHNKTGVCVTEQGEECKNVRSGVSCRPGQLGIPSDFVFCPAREECDKKRRRGQQTGDSNSGFLFNTGGITGTLQSIVTGVMPSTPLQTVKEIIGG